MAEDQIKSPQVIRHETAAKIASIRRRLGELKQNKRLIALEGLEPDQDDKRIESELIVRLLRLEKGPRPAEPSTLSSSKLAPRSAGRVSGKPPSRLAKRPHPRRLGKRLPKPARASVSQAGPASTTPFAPLVFGVFEGRKKARSSRTSSRR